MKRKFFYNIPENVPDKSGNIVLMEKNSASPLEFFQYGINQSGKFYLRWDYSLFGDDELECDYREISKERIMNDLIYELNICRQEGNDNIAAKITEFLSYIEK